jgi:hypothetical protein
MLVDPNDARNRRLTGFTLVKLGRVLTAKGQATAALATLNQALAVFRELARTAPTSDYLSHSFGNVYGQIGDTHAALAADSRVSRPQQRAHWTEACSWYQKSMQIRLDLQRRGELLHDDIGAMAEVAKKMAKCDATAEPPKASSLIRFQSLPK